MLVSFNQYWIYHYYMALKHAVTSLVGSSNHPMTPYKIFQTSPIFIHVIDSVVYLCIVDVLWVGCCLVTFINQYINEVYYSITEQKPYDYVLDWFFSMKTMMYRAVFLLFTAPWCVGKLSTLYYCLIARSIFICNPLNNNRSTTWEFWSDTNLTCFSSTFTGRHTDSFL